MFLTLARIEKRFKPIIHVYIHLNITEIGRKLSSVNVNNEKEKSSEMTSLQQICKPETTNYITFLQ